VERIVPDTSVLIDWLRAGRHQELLLRTGAIKYLSAVVAMELVAGAWLPRDRDTVAKLVRGYRAAGRLLVPTGSNYEQAGALLRSLRAKGRDSRIANDVLIALSARAIGATVVTGDGVDFRAIQGLCAFELVVV
jgi:predicted nucleic acid-binding protein